MRRPVSISDVRTFLGRRSRHGAGGHSTGVTGLEGTVPRAAAGGGGAGLRPVGADAGQGRA
jgi:hypothetical protein